MFELLDGWRRGLESSSSDGCTVFSVKEQRWEKTMPALERGGSCMAPSPYSSCAHTEAEPENRTRSKDRMRKDPVVKR
jgi:hypothetical protein